MEVVQIPLAPKISPLNSKSIAADKPIPAPPNKPAGNVGTKVGIGAADNCVVVGFTGPIVGWEVTSCGPSREGR